MPFGVAQNFPYLCDTAQTPVARPDILRTINYLFVFFFSSLTRYEFSTNWRLHFLQGQFFSPFSITFCALPKNQLRITLAIFGLNVSKGLQPSP
jgi:hypothetical protein